MPYFVYILRCADGSLYTGSTTDVAARFLKHKNGTGAKYTRSHKPVAITYTKKMRARSAALKREAAIKKMTRAQKLKLIAKK